MTKLDELEKRTNEPDGDPVFYQDVLVALGEDVAASARQATRITEILSARLTKRAFELAFEGVARGAL